MSQLRSTATTITPQLLQQRLRAADRNHNGWLLDASDQLPRFGTGSRQGLVMVDAEIQSRYRRLSQGTTPAQLGSYTGRLFLRDTQRQRVDPQNIVALMRHNGGHPVRLSDLAWLYPNAKIRGEGLTLSQLAQKQIRSQSHRQGVSLGQAYLDPGGELIVSHFYQRELKAAAPSFTQFMTNSRDGRADRDCYNSSQAFSLQACHPDSWPVGLDTLLKHASLDMPLQGSRDFSAAARRRREGIISFLASESSTLAGVTRRSGRIKISLRGAQNVRRILERLNERFPELHCDPANAQDMAFHLGRSASPSSIISAKTHRRVLLAILDDSSLRVTYRDADANNPALFNGAAQQPALHFMARIDPSDPEQVVFAILHIDAQSYKPRGTTGHDRILAPGEGPSGHAQPQHQGEVEPIYLQYRRSENSPQLRLQRVFLGDHLVAEPIAPGQYTGELAVAYGSGGRILRRANTTWVPGMQYRTGSQSAASTYFSTVGDSQLFPYIEVYPGRADTRGTSPTAHRFTRHDYTLLVEGENGDFLTTGRLLSYNGKEGAEADNTGGFPFVRGSRAPGDRVERSRTDVGFGSFLRRNESYEENRLMGRVARNLIVGSVLPPLWVSTRPSPIFADGSYRIGVHYKPVNNAWVGPRYLEGYLYNPFSPSVPQSLSPRSPTDGS